MVKTGLKTGVSAYSIFAASPLKHGPRVVFDGAKENALTPESVAKIVNDSIATAFAARDEADKKAREAKEKAEKEAAEKAAKEARKKAKAKKEADDDDNDPDADNPDDDADTRLAKLNRRSAKYRTKAKELEDKLAKEAEDRQKAIDDALNKQRDEGNARLIRAELRAQLKASGAVNVDDALKLLDVSKLKIDEHGEVSGVDELLTATRKEKPYLFAEVTTANNPRNVPRPPGAPQVKNAADMDDKEYEAELAALTARK